MGTVIKKERRSNDASRLVYSDFVPGKGADGKSYVKIPLPDPRT